jgi:hypothetical protein
MATHAVVTGDTWQSIASDAVSTVERLLRSNGCDPTNPPPDPAAGSVVVLPDAPSACAVAPGNANTVDLGAHSVHTLQMQLYDDDGSPMTNVRYCVSFFGHVLRGTSPDGWVTITYPALTCASVEVDWGDPTDGSNGYLHSVTLLTENYQGEYVDKVAVSSGSGSLSNTQASPSGQGSPTST